MGRNKKYNICLVIIDTLEKFKRLNRPTYKYKWTIEIPEISFFKKRKRKVKQIKKRDLK